MAMMMCLRIGERRRERVSVSVCVCERERERREREREREGGRESERNIRYHAHLTHTK
jgi:hypothetical protein